MSEKKKEHGDIYLTGGTCRSCKGPILWGKTKEGKNTPVNLPVKKFIMGRSGFLILVPTYESHFVTCPQADQWRKK